MTETAIHRQPWTLDQASALCDDLEDVVSHHGFLLSVYGSTLRKGHGRDLDIILSQKRCGTAPAYVIDAVKRHLNAKVLVLEESLFAEKCALLLMPDGHVLDIQVRMSPIRDAYDLYLSKKTTSQD